MSDGLTRPTRVRPLAALVTVMALLAGLLTSLTPPLPAAAVGTVLFDNSFANNTVDGVGTVTKPLTASGTNVACLTAAGNTSTPPLLSCATNTDAQGSGKLRLTPNSGSQVGGVFGASSFPTVNGLDVTFNSYQWGGGGADGMAFVLAAVDPANPVPPAAVGPSGGSLGYASYGGVNGLTNAYLGVGLDTYGNFSSPTYQGSGCTNQTNISGQVAGAVVVRGPGTAKVGYCGLASSYDGTAASKLTLRAATRAAAVVPVQVLINPTAAAFTSATGVSVAAGTYKVVATPVGGTAKVISGSLPAASSTLYPSTTWTTAAGVPKQLVFGFVGSTGSINDNHEVSNVKAVTFNPVPVLTVDATSYATATPAPGAPVNYTLVPKVQAGADVTKAISVTETTPVGVVPLGAYSPAGGWNCAAPVGRTITCTTTATSFANGTTLPTINVLAIVTGNGVTSGMVQSGSNTTIASADSNPGGDTVTTAGTVPTAPNGLTGVPTLGPTAGGGSLSIAGSDITGPSVAVEIGTAAELAAGTPTVLLPCPGAPAAGCFTANSSGIFISPMPARAGGGAVKVTVVTLGVSGALDYTYADKPTVIATPTATAGLANATVSWVAPASNGSAVTSYLVTPYAAGVAQAAVSFAAAAGTTQQIAGLTVGTAYTFTVSAVNAAGTSAASAQSAAVTPYAVPGAPTITTVGAGAQGATLRWTAPGSNGSNAITGYRVTPYLNGVAQTTLTFPASAAGTTQTIGGLTAGRSYTFTVAAQNAGGYGAESAASTAVTPTAQAPGVPPPQSTVGGAYSYTFSSAGFTAPVIFTVSDGSLPPGLTLSAGGLLSGTPTLVGTYVWTVRISDASNVVSRTVTQVVAPAPTLTLNPATGAVGSAYSAQPTVAGGTGAFTWTVPVGSLPAGVTIDTTTGLIAGTPTLAGSYSVTVRVSDSYGVTGSKAVTFVIVGKPAVPAAPTATAGLTSAVVSWVAPDSNGSVITGYTITPYVGGVAQTAITVDPSAKTRTLNGLTAGSVYTFTVAATNSEGTSDPSAASNPVTPYAALSAPTITATAVGDSAVTLTWTAPSSNGGSAITGYVVTPYIGSVAQTPQTFTGTATTQTVTGLTPGTAYTFRVAATNLSGSNVLYRINAAGPTVAAIDGGPAWAADDTDPNPLRSGGATAGSPAGQVSADYTVPATTPNAIFDTERYADMAWTLPVTSSAPVKVRLYFANHYAGTSTVGSRVFDVSLDGTKVLPAFDPIAAAGADHTGTMREFAITSDGTVNIDFARITENPLIYGIEVIQTGTATAGPASASSASATPNASPTLTFAAPPPAPIGVAYSQQLTVTGGTAPFGWSVTTGTLPAGITLSSGGLLSGTPTASGSYTFTVQVVDGNGQSATKSVTLVVTDKPAAPAAPTATAGVTSATVTWVAPASNGSAITGYIVTAYMGGVAQTQVYQSGSSTTRVMTGLTAGSVYSFTVAALNGVGTSPPSPQSNSVVPYAVPAAPVITAATAADSAANLTWTAPATNGSPVTGYLVTPYIGSVAQATQSFSGSTTTGLITGLTPGTSYTFTVAATNAAGTGPASAASTAVVPNTSPTLTFANPPSAPVGVAYSQQLEVTGGTAPFSWSVTAGTLPAGITLSAGGLLSGTPTTSGSYTFTVQVVDGSGQSATKSVTLVVTDKPATPAAPTATAGITSATVTWVAPASNGSALTGYVVTPYRGGVAQTPVSFDASTTTQTLTGLTSGSVYSFTVAAVNAVGTSSASPASNSVVPYAVPAAPMITAATAADSAANLTWTAPATNGSAITGYLVTPYIGATAQATQSFSGTTTSAAITGLTPGTSYTFTVAAQNAAGTGPASAASSAVVPNASPALTFAAPPPAAIGVAYSHQLTPTGGTGPFAWSVTTGTLPAGITLSAGGLLAGTPTTLGSSTFTVRVVDASSQSATRSITLVVTDKPATPAAPTATAGLRSATVSWVAPASNNSALTGYLVTPYKGGVAQPPVSFDASSTTRTLTGLTPGSVYTFTVAAVNDTGTSTASPVSNMVVPYAVPAAPVITAASAADSGANLAWTAPAANGSPITGYIVTPYIGAAAQATQSFSGSTTTAALTGLTPGTSYTFTVAAQNSVGTGPASVASAAVVPNASPTLTFANPPAGPVGVAYSQQLTVTDGTAPFTWSVTSGAPPAGITLSAGGLLSGTPTTSGSYTFTVQVVDASGQTASKSLTLVITAKPAAPAAPTATAGVGSATLTWVAPVSNGSALTGYVVTPYKAGVAQTPVTFDASVTTRTLTGLTVNSNYTFTVAAVNAIGTSAASPVSNSVVPYAVPGTPVITAATAADSAVNLRWTAPAANGSPISSYVVTPYIGAVAQATQSFAGSTTAAITGLTPGTSYTFTVAAVNAAGLGAPSAASAVVIPNASPSLVFPAPPAGQVNVAYSTQLTVTDGTAPFTWSLSAGALPPGLTLGASTGLLSGTPTSNGTYTFTVLVSDGSGQTATRAVTLVIAAAPTITFAPAAGEVGVAYSQQPTVSGGTGPFTWVVSAGSLPAGVTINSTTGLLSGTPTASGSFGATLRATDSLSQATTKAVTIVIAAAPTLTSVPPAGQSGEPYAFSFVATGGTGPFTYSVVAGALPSGLTLSTGGLLSGTTTAVTSTSFTVKVVDSFGMSATDAVTLVIGAAPVSVVKTADATSTTPGSVVRFTVTVTNSSTTKTFNGAQVVDPLGDVTDDAGYNNDAAVMGGTVTKNASNLIWNLDIAPGSSTTLTYTVTVANPGTGNKVLTGTVSTSFLSTNCNPGTQDSGCTATVNISTLSIVKTANVATTTPGATVTFTILVTNNGQTAYPGATLTDFLGDAGVLDDATYNGNASATSGSLSYAGSALTWTGALAVGASATITYGVTVSNPDTGNKSVSSTVVSSSAGSTCPGGNPAASCTAAVTVLVPALVITNTADVSTATPGSRVNYQITLANTGQTAYSSISVNVGYGAMVDDATYNNDAVASSGSVALNYGLGAFVWTGDIPVGDTVTITASVTVLDPDPGNKVLTTVASSSAAGNTCPAGSGSSACTSNVSVLVPALTIAKSSNMSSTTPGSVVVYTVLVTNTGQTPYTGATFTDALAGVLDDAVYDNNAAATVGSVSYAAPTLTWTGNLAVGASATITYSATVFNPDPGDKSLTGRVTSPTQGNNCLAASTDAGCTSTVTVLIPGLTFSPQADVTTTTPGSVVRYTTTVTNTGETTYTGLPVVLDSSDTLDDATNNGDTSVSQGSLQPGSAGTGTWTITLAPGQSASITGTFTVNSPPTGNRSMTSSVSADVQGSSCPPGTTSSACSVTVAVLIPGLTITKTANAPTVLPGGTVSYTVVVANTGQTSYPAATFTDPLTGVLGDATYAGGATATSGTLSYASSTLSWTGALAVGATATISYAVTVLDPDPGDKQLGNTVESTSAGSNCPSGGTDPRCTASVFVRVPGLTILKTADATTTTPGATVGYTVKVTNSGQTPYLGAAFSDPLTGVLDDATYNANAAATVGTPTYSAGTLIWTGDLAVGASATITYSVTVTAAGGGDNVLTNTVTSSTRGNNCPASSSDLRCSVQVPVARLLLVRSPAEATTTPGSVVHLPVTFTNVGKVAYTGISVTIPRLDTADDVFATGVEVPSSGALSTTPDATVWTGDIPVGGVVTIAFTRTVKNPDTGNLLIAATLVSSAPGNNCPAGGTDPRCSMAIPVLIPALTITKTASTTQVEPGGAIGYTLTVRNTGQTVYTSAVVTDAMAGALDEAGYAHDAVATSGTVSYAAPNLTWTGNLAIGATATITYTMTALMTSPGDKDIRNTVSSTEAGSTCPPGSASAACVSSVTILTPGLTLTKSADLTSATLGATVTFTVRVANTGQTSYPAAAFSDSLAAVLDDATYNAGATTASRGTVSYAGGTLSWSGTLAPGDTATVTYQVTIKNPAAGDRSLANTLVSDSVGNNCAPTSTDSRCAVVVTVTNAPALTFTKTASAATTVPGGIVTYTVRVANASTTPIAGVSFTDALAGVLDDATYNADATASSGVVSFGSPNLSWTGTVPAQGAVTVSYSVTVAMADNGDDLLSGAVSSTSVPGGNNCLSGSTDPRCASTVPVARLTISTGDYASTTTPGSALLLGLTYTNTGQVPYTNISISTDAGDLLDDVDLTGTETASSGELTIGGVGATWVGDIPVGGVVTLSSTFAVKSPATGNRNIFAVTFTDAPGSNCGRGSVDTACTATTAVLVPGLSITKTASTSATVAGGVVGYTVTVHNTGETPYAGAVVSDTMAGTLDDAVYNADATATRGSVAYGDPTLTWTGDLAVGETATITYSTTVNNPASGDKTMVNRVTSTDAGSTCPPASGNSACRTTVVVLTPALTITKTADQANATLGSTVTYTVSVRNTGQTSYSAAAFNDSLADVLDESTYNSGSATATSGTVSYASPVLSWSGALSPGASATITYSVSITNPATGDGAMTNVVISNNVGSNCRSGSVDSRCRVLVSVTNALSLTFTKTSDVKAAAVGDQVHYTVQVVNSSSSAIAGVNFTDPLAAILDDATFGNDAAATSGTVSYAAPNLSWTGDVPAAGTVTITYSVTVTGSGDQVLTGAVSSTSLPASNNCLAGSTDPRCTNRVTVARLLIQQSYAESTTTPGSVIHLTATFTNTGKTDYEGITISSPNADSLDDAAPTGDQSATSGTLVLSASAITWSGDIGIGQTVTVTGTLVVHNPDLGNRILTGTLASSALGNNCPSGGSDLRCTATSTVLIPGLTVTKTADTGAVAPGGTVGYTITVYNSGQAAYPAASFSDSLTGVLDDAAYNGDAQASTGSLSYATTTLSWTGSLAVGATATISYSVTVPASSPGGDRTMANTVVSNEAGSNCPTASGNASCHTTVIVLTPALTIAKTADLTTATLGSTVSYTVTVTNSGQVAYPAAQFSDDLAGVLDDASYGGSPLASSGTLSYAGGVLSWTGALNPGQSASVSYAVTVHNPATGDLSLTNAVTSNNLGNNCRQGSADARCRTQVTVVDAVSLTFTKTADVAATVAGAVVHYTVKVANASGAPISGVDFTDALAGTLDDAVDNNDAVASSGSTSYTAPNLTWVGTVPAGSSITVTYSVTVQNPDPGDLLLTSVVSSTSVPASDNCVVGSTDSRCATTVGVARLELRQFAAETTTTPGSVVHLTQTYVNTGQVAYVGITVSSPRADTSDDTVPTGDQVASSGTVLRTPTEVAWTGDIAVGGTVTITRTLVVKNPDPGNHLITATLRSDAVGNNCPSGTTDPRCTFSVTVLTPGLSISKTANTTFVQPNGVVSYTITVANTGQTSYLGATVTDTLTGVLDDADYNADATTTTGSVSYTSPQLSWTGDLAVGAAATITFTVTAHQRVDGDKSMHNQVSSTDVGNSCPPGGGNPACTSTVDVRTPALTTVVTASEATAKPGDVVSYSVTVTNTGQTDFVDATVNAPLAGLLDDATYDGNAAASAGSVVHNAQSLDWSGALAMGASVTITYSVTIANPVTGNHRLEQTVTSPSQWSNCAGASTDPRCSTSVPIASLAILGSSDVLTTKPTGVVHYANTFTNTGQVPYTAISVIVDVLGAADDANYNGDATATSGSVAITAGARIVWTGNLAVGETVTFTASITVKNPDPGDRVIASTITSNAPGSNCPTASTDPACHSLISVLIPQLSITKSADTATTTPGGTVNYTIAVHNTGQLAYTGAVVTDFLGGVTRDADDASYAGTPTATSGTVVFTNPGLRWTGDLALNQTVLIHYHVLVDDPDLGDRSIVNIVSSDELGSTCPSGTANPSCEIRVGVLVPKLDIGVVADRTTTTPGSTVTYTVTVHNTGQTPYAGASVTAALAGVLDDATYTGGATSTLGGTFAYTSSNLTWTGDLGIDATTVLTYAVTVNNPDPGNRQLSTSVTSAAAGSTCRTTTDCVNTVQVLIPGLSVSTSADVATATPGDRVTYTITLANTGQTPYVGATATSVLTGVLDDSTLNGTIHSSIGVASYTSPTLTWTGSLPVGATAVITYSVTVRTPDPANKRLTNTVVVNAAGSTCPTGSTNPSCTNTVTVLVPALSITKSASVTTTTPGGTITYTINLANTGETAYPGAVVTDSLSNVLTDATYDADAAVTGGGVLGYADSTLTWTGDLLVGASATITYSVTVKNPDPGDKYLTNIVTSSAPGSSCPPGNTAPACGTGVTVLVPELDLAKTVDRSSVTAGGVVHYTITATNSGQTAYAPATFTDPLGAVLDDADYAGDAVASIGSVSVANGTLAWTGPLAIGETATITYSVTTRFPAVGDRSLTNTVTSASAGSTCATGDEAVCRTTVSVLVPALTIAKTADRNAVVAGDHVDYTITATNTGEADYPAASVSDALAGLVGHAAYNSDVTATRGTVSYAAGTLTWNGPLARAESVTITFSVTVPPTDPGGTALTNRVESNTVGSSCLAGSTNPACATSTDISPGNIGLEGLTPSFVLTGAPGSTVSLDGAVGMHVVTNSFGGYTVTVRGTETALHPQTSGNPDTIPLAMLSVRESGNLNFTPLSSTLPVVVHSQSTASSLAGDAISNDYRVDVPFVASDTYDTTLEYVVTAR